MDNNESSSLSIQPVKAGETRKIYILEMHTNGHKAALRAIQEQRWNATGCQIIRCRTHEEIIESLKRQRSFAVLPVSNSITGPVKEVLPHLAAAESRGYYFRELMRFDLPIEHVLAAPTHIGNVSRITKVYSHRQPFLQSVEFLTETLGTAPSEETIGKGKLYEPCGSTAEAAEIVSRASEDECVAAVTTREAAEAWGLKILAEHIEDSPDNRTTFVLLENQAEIERKVVGIIGIKGSFGRLLEEFFKSIGCPVIGSDPADPDSISAEALVSHADVVIISVPIPDAPKVAEDIRPWLRKDQLLMDVTSIKGPVMDVMLQGAAEVAGLHPMFRPDMPFAGQVMVVCPAHMPSLLWKNWLVNVLTAMQVRIEWTTAENHDRFMSVVQVLVHISNLISALCIGSAEVSARKSLDFASPIYKIALALIGRMVGQNPGLYSSIIIHNPYTIQLLESRIETERRLLDIVKRKDQSAFEELFREASEKLGDHVIKYSNELFSRILSVVNILASPNSVLLECPLSASQPGLLMRILSAFAARKVNVSGIDSLEAGGLLQFAVRFEQPKDSLEVLEAIREVCSWDSPRILATPLDDLRI